MLKFFSILLGKINWERPREIFTGRRYNLTIQDWHKILEVMREKPRIIVTYRKAHLSTWAVRLAEIFLKGKWGTYGHALVGYVGTDHGIHFDDFRFIESVGSGVKHSKWEEVFNVDGVCILDFPFSHANPTEALNNIFDDVGKKYDHKQNPMDDSVMSCVEVAKEYLEGLDDYQETMRVFTYMVNRKKRLSPDMFRDCPDFKVVLEIKR